MIEHWEAWQWALVIAGALLVGVSKTGVGGLGMLAVVIFARLMPPKQASGVVLPLLMFGDIVAVIWYRRHMQWRFLVKLFPWTAAGVIIGWLAMGRIDDQQAGRLIGILVLSLVVLHLVRRRLNSAEQAEHGWWFAPAIGVFAGFTTLIANAAGPLMVIYLIAMRLPKMEFVGTGALFFMLLNWFKVPFMVDLDLITTGSLALNLWLAPAVFAGAFAGRKLVERMNQRVFENLALGLAAIAAISLLL